MTRTVTVALALSGEPSTTATALLRERSMVTRVARAVGGLLGMWAIAGICVFLPIVHFVLVPAFLLVGVVVAVVRLGDDCSLVEVRGVCPRCKVARVLPSSGKYRPGRQVHCDGCGSQLELHPG